MKDKKDQKKSQKDIKKELEKTQKKVEEYTDDLKRLQAEFENHIKRTDKEKKDLCEYASASLIKKLLPVVDDFESALKQIKDKEVLSGMEMICKNIKNILTEEGIKEIRSEGVVDPFRHEVILQKDSDKEEGTILEVVQKGYELKGKVLRPSKVIVSKNS